MVRVTGSGLGDHDLVLGLGLGLDLGLELGLEV